MPARTNSMVVAFSMHEMIEISVKNVATPLCFSLPLPIYFPAR